MSKVIPWAALLLSSVVYAQGSVQVWSDRTSELPAAKVENAAQGTPSPALPADAPAEVLDSHHVNEVEALREKAAKDPTAKLGVEIDRNLLELQAALDGGASSFDILNNPKLRQNLIKAFESNPMKDVPPAQLEAALKKSEARGLFERFPALMKFMVNFMRHPTALAQLVKSLERREAWRNCLAASLTLMVLLFFLKHKLMTDKTPWWKKTLYSLGNSVFFFCCSLSIALFVFSEELGPTIDVIKQTFF